MNINPFDTIEEKLNQIERLILRLTEDKSGEKKIINYLSRQEAANLLKISLPTLNEYTRTGIIKGSRVGSRVLYLEEDIINAVKEIPVLKYKRT
ncbi:MAG TPA: helix-turn-helix domain-containing protein [Bacteroidales bacterium]|jgi:excisionase family DNA binding protein|nr:helix-turn-helix domain-containing protein [Bacteroidales bacterium]HPM86337.1 helix-turn-helix domain-containing protein [Bacteroidales bacterium]